MACNHCDATELLVNLNLAAGDFTLEGNFALTGKAYTYGAFEDTINREFLRNGDILSAGSRVRNRTDTIRVSCSDSATALYDAFKNGQNMCGSASVVDNCCGNENYASAEVINITKPAIGDSVNYFEIELLAVFAPQ